MVDEATRLELPAPRSLSGTSIVTPVQAMRLLEARRARTYAAGSAALALVGVGIIASIGGDPFAQRIHVASLLVFAVVAGGLAIARRDPARYTPNMMVAIGIAGVPANVTGFYYWGVFSAYLGVVTASGYAFSSCATRRTTIAISIAVVGSTLALQIAELAGWIADRGIVQVTSPATGLMQGALVAVAAFVLTVAVLGGYDTRAQTRRILDEHHAALRELSQREAQLAEAREAAREAFGPNEGRFTGAQLGRFKLGVVLGRGAMGEVYDAVDDRGAPCAVKVLAKQWLGDDDALRRFDREARAIAGLDAPNIVRLFDVSPPGAEQPYIAMERLVGRDLAALVKERPVRELGEVVAIVRAVAAGLDAAHAAGIVHRDLKPANVFAAEDGGRVTWKILDFGVSKLFDGDATLTHGQLVGTPGYMAPEQASGEPADRRADVYALGVVAYRLLVGRPAVVPGDVPAMIHEVVFKMPPRPSAIASVPADVEAVLAIALAKSPDARFATAAEFAHALARAADGSLAPELATRAAVILRRAPWDGWLAGRRATTTT